MFTWAAHCAAQVNILASNRLDTLTNFASCFGETQTCYVFAANYQKAHLNIGDLTFQTARLIAINKSTHAEVRKTFAAINDTTHYISCLQVINDTVHVLRIKSWYDNLTDYYHFNVYSEKYGSQLQEFSSKMIQTFVDTAHTISPITTALFKDDVYYFSSQYTVAMPPPYFFVGAVHYSIYDRKTDTSIVYTQRLNPTYQTTPSYYELAATVSADDTGNIIVSANINHDVNNWSSYKDQIIVKLSKGNNYTQPEEVRYKNYDSTNMYVMIPAGGYFPYIEKKKNVYYFLSRSTAQYFDTIGGIKSNNNFGIYKGHFADSCVNMDTSYNTRRKFIYTHLDGSVGQYRSNRPLIFKGDTILLIYAGNDLAGDYYPYPCQDSLSGLEILALDTNFNEIRKFTIVNYQRNADPYGYDFTKEGAIMVYGALCPRGGPLDSLNLFAFLIDFKTGFPLNIFNAEGFINTNVYKAYPNPMSNELIVEGMKSATATIILYDMQGKKLKELPITDYKTVIDTRNLPPGLYIYQVTDAVRNIHQSGKIMKQ